MLSRDYESMAEGECMTQIVTNLLNPHPDSSIPIRVHFRSPYKLERRANALSRRDDTRSEVRAVPIFNYRRLSIQVFLP